MLPIAKYICRNAITKSRIFVPSDIPQEYPQGNIISFFRAEGGKGFNINLQVN